MSHAFASEAGGASLRAGFQRANVTKNDALGLMHMGG